MLRGSIHRDAAGRNGQSGDVSADSLEQLAAEVRPCVRCRLAETRTRAVPGQGDAAAPLVLVGEAPGATEDATGLPFQGLAGRFLDRSLGAIGVERARLYITSVNKCRPPGNRTPRPDEMAACAGYLDRQLALLAPRVVLAMGQTAARRLHPAAGKGVTLGALRSAGTVRLGPLVLMVTYHPAAAMRFPAQRPAFLQDLRSACRLAGLVT